MFFKILGQAISDTLEELVDDIKSTAEWLKDRIISIIAILFASVSAIFLAGIIAEVVKYTLGVNAISLLVYLCSAAIIIIPYVLFLIRFYVNFNERKERFLKDKEETFRRLSE